VISRHSAWFAALLWCCVAPAFAADEAPWTDDFLAALDTAEKDSKDILMNFTGSDWCQWCDKLDDEVFKQEAFQREAPKLFVLVKVDFPRKKPTRAGNEILQREFRVIGFPTIVLTDAKGRAYARTGYHPGGVEKFLKQLDELRKQKAARDDLFAKAEKAEGLEKAKLLDKALSDLDAADVLTGYNDEVEQILKLDAEDKGGLRSKYRVKNGVLEIEKTLFETRDLKAAVTKIDALVKDLKPESETKQYVLYLKARALHDQGDNAGMLATLQAAVDADPLSEAGQAIAKRLQELKNPGPKPKAGEQTKAGEQPKADAEPDDPDEPKEEPPAPSILQPEK
jgi:thioredoxin-related protein